MFTRKNPSVVLVYFKSNRQSYPYLNDQFDLEIGDYVYVEGKLEGKLGKVVEQSFNFSIDLSKYKRVLSHTRFKLVGEFVKRLEHYYATDVSTLPPEKVFSILFPPIEMFESIHESKKSIKDLNLEDVRGKTSEDIDDWYKEYGEYIKYVHKYGSKVYAVVEGRYSHDNHRVQFELSDESLCYWSCSCYDVGVCPHILLVIEYIYWVQAKYGSELAESFVSMDEEIKQTFIQPESKIVLTIK